MCIQPSLVDLPISLVAIHIVTTCLFDFIDLTTGEKSITMDVSGI